MGCVINRRENMKKKFLKRESENEEKWERRAMRGVIGRN